jgi:hypothetical protein
MTYRDVLETIVTVIALAVGAYLMLRKRED